MMPPPVVRQHSNLSSKAESGLVINFLTGSVLKTGRPSLREAVASDVLAATEDQEGAGKLRRLLP